MATADRASDSGIHQIAEFVEAQATAPPGDRLAALRLAADEFRARFRAQAQVRAVRTVDLESTPYPAASAFHGAARGINPWLTAINRLVVVQFEDFEGRLRTLAWRPALPSPSGRLLWRAERHAPPPALARVGLAPGDVDLLAVDHLEPPPSEPPSLPTPTKATLVLQRRELDALRWKPDRLHEDRLLVVDGDVELGLGCALMHTPGRTDGNQSLCLNTPEGIWVCSSNGVAADSWQPASSRIPGVRAWAQALGREAVVNAGAPVEWYESMIKEKALADVNRRDPRWLNVLPCSELAPRRRQWPVRPTFVQGSIDCGRITAAAVPADMA